MILAFDTYYFLNNAKTVAIAFNDWADEVPQKIYSELKNGIAPYEPGAFYKRELPCILSLLTQINQDNLEAIIVDGFVLLDDDGKLGLGGYLYEALRRQVPIIGVAKSSFLKNRKNVKSLLRGESKKPLFISALGIDLEDAHRQIRSMHGTYRMPTLLKVLDSKTRE